MINVIKTIVITSWYNIVYTDKHNTDVIKVYSTHTYPEGVHIKSVIGYI